MSLEIGGVIAAIILGGIAVWRVLRAERRPDAWIEADGALAEANERVDATIAAHRDYVSANAQERTQMEDALASERRRRAGLESQLVELKADLAKKQIELAEQMHQCARLEHRVDQLLAGNAWPTVDQRPPHLDRDEED